MLAEAPQLRDLGRKVAHEAGAVLLSIGHDHRDLETKSSASDWVSDADRAAELTISSALHDARPLDGIVGEEGSNHPSSSGVTWVVDPLDGTTNYVRGYPGWAVSIGIVHEGTPIAAVVHDPVAQTTYSALAGYGSERDGEPIRVSTCSELAAAIVGTGFSYRSETRAHQAGRLALILPAVADIRRGGSAALELCHVAEGGLDAFYEDDLEEWDWIAGSLIVIEAGGAAQSLKGDSTRGIVAGPSGLVAQLLTAFEQDDSESSCGAL